MARLILSQSVGCRGFGVAYFIYKFNTSLGACCVLASPVPFGYSFLVYIFEVHTPASTSVLTGGQLQLTVVPPSVSILPLPGGDTEAQKASEKQHL